MHRLTPDALSGSFVVLQAARQSNVSSKRIGPLLSGIDQPSVEYDLGLW